MMPWTYAQALQAVYQTDLVQLHAALANMNRAELRRLEEVADELSSQARQRREAWEKAMKFDGRDE